MKPIEFIIMLLPLWLLTHFWILPLLKNRWEAGDLKQKIARSSSLIFAEKIREFSAIAIVAILCLMGFIWLNAIFFSGNLVVASSLVNSFDSLLNIVNSIKKEYGNFLIWSGLLGAGVCLYLISKQAKQKLTTAWLEKTAEIRERFNEEFSAFEALAEDPELLPVVERAKEILAILTLAENETSDIQLSVEQAEALNQELEHSLLFLAMEKAKSEIDLDEALQRPEQNEQKQPTTSLKRVLRILGSSQFFKDLGIINRPLSYLAMGLLAISLTGWAAVPLANSMQLSVNNLRINAISDDVSRQLDQAVSAIDEADNDTEDSSPEAVEQALQITQLSRTLAREAVNQLLYSQGIDAGKRSSVSKSEFVRATILEQSIDPEMRASSAQKVRYDVADKVANAGQNKNELAGLVDNLEREIKRDLEVVQKRNPSYFSELLNRIESRYSTSLNAFDAQSNLVSRMVNQAFSPINTDATNELVKQSSKILKDVGSNSVKTWANSYAKAVVTDALFEQSRASVVDKLNQNFQFKTSQQTKQFFNSLTLAENTGWRPSPKELNERKISERMANNIANRYSDDAVKAAVRQSLGGYSGLFPDAAAAAYDIGGGVSGSGNHSSAKSGSKAHIASRSTSFKLASRSFRVRGVLFGQEMTGENLTVSDIQWHVTPQSGDTPTLVSISLNLNGQWHNIGEYPAAIVNQGIRYAADQRVVATTITSGDKEVVGRVTYLHPVLADTPLGCRVIEADRFVDTFTFPREDNIEPRLTPIYEDRAALAHLLGFSNLVERLGYANQYEQCPLAELDQLIKEANIGNIDLSPTLLANFEQFQKSEIKLPGGSGKLIDVSLKCASVSLTDTASCLCDSLNGGLNSKYWFPEDHTSQFREKPAELDEDLQWLTLSEDRFKHIDLWLHTTFALRELSYSGDGIPDESTATAMDFEEQQLAILKQVIVSKLLQPYLISDLNHPSVDDFMAPLEQFVVIQRLVRAAFNGQLGDSFPLEKLIVLNRETQAFVPKQPTMRWEPHVGNEPELLQELANTDKQALQLYIDFVEDRIQRTKNKKPICAAASL
jgi:hypothetical protein